MSDSEISKKVGVQVCFPQTICEDFRLIGKSDGVSIIQSVAYDDYDEVSSKITNAIYSEDAFKSLSKYEPFRCAGAYYKNSAGMGVNIYVNNTVIPLEEYLKNSSLIQIKVITETKVGDISAKWLDFSSLNYNRYDYTQKTNEKISASTLFWSTDRATFNISVPLDQKLSLDEAVKIAEAFMAAQK